MHAHRLQRRLKCCLRRTVSAYETVNAKLKATALEAARQASFDVRAFTRILLCPASTKHSPFSFFSALRRAQHCSLVESDAVSGVTSGVSWRRGDSWQPAPLSTSAVSYAIVRSLTGLALFPRVSLVPRVDRAVRALRVPPPQLPRPLSLHVLSAVLLS